ncbi:hypothetical protein [Atlantibacter hermannii]|uniref:hypothetical protein n=1 Tax=Atlantibacter hermannii TaxID=565 RepID=UPI0028A71D8E|nr:hypothetical protein [Atlantibacter hermannii]
MTFTKEDLIEKAREQIAFCRHTKITGEGRTHVNQCSALFEIALAALESRADAEPAEIDERAAFNAWNNDTDCPLAGRDAKSAAWLAWSRRAAMLAAAPKQEEQQKK